MLHKRRRVIYHRRANGQEVPLSPEKKNTQRCAVFIKLKQNTETVSASLANFSTRELMRLKQS